VTAEREYSPGLAFVLWLTCLFGLCGLHRFYLGRPISGFLYLITLGFLGIGQIVDLARMDAMVDRANRVAGGRRPPQLRAPPLALRDPTDDLRRALLRGAAERGGRLSVTQGVMLTGRGFKEVEQVLDDMVASGYVDIDNEPDSGIVVYRFGELSPA
jgi:TM2 domain-containing membrane protein YozV